jgi:hypothetical protein
MERGLLGRDEGGGGGEGDSSEEGFFSDGCLDRVMGGGFSCSD